jgi:micrococcal nuclease
MPLRTHTYRIVALSLAAVAFTQLPPADLHPHAGALDDFGCHASGKGRSYHCHQGQFAGQSFGSRTEMLTARSNSYSTLPPEEAREQFSGQVIRVASGDEITVLHSGEQRRVRLNDVVCPRKGQSFAVQAKRFTWFMVSNRDVVITVIARDPDGSVRGTVTLPDGRALSREIIKEGLCWRHPKRATDHRLMDLEALSRAEKRGLWSDPFLHPPWETADR